MKLIRFALGSFLFLAFFASASMAQSQRTFVSVLGNDANPCSRTSPCRTFAQAIPQTNAGGEVIVLDSAGYGPAAITKSISIIAAPGIYAGVSVFSGDGIDVNGGVSDTAVLRGLTVNNQGSTGNGIGFGGGGTLHVESCVVNGFNASGNGYGIVCNGGGELEVKDSILRGNRVGIFIFGTSAAAVDQVRLETNSGEGLSIANGALVTVRGSVASGNGGSGFYAASDTPDGAHLDIESCVAFRNSTGIFAEAFSSGIVTIRVSNSTVTGNRTGLHIDGGQAFLLSRGNNTVDGNTTNTVGTLGSYTAK